jgi:hypothetical protein
MSLIGDVDDRHHAASLALLETHPGPLIVPSLLEPVLPSDWLRIAARLEAP